MTILADHPIIAENKPGEEKKSFLDESVARRVLFSEKKKDVPSKSPKELMATKKFLKSLIVEAWKELQ